MLTGQLSVRVDDLDQITRRDGPAAGPAARDARRRAGRGDRPVRRACDDLPPTDAVRLDGPTVRVVVRPSGTEPKLKAYLEARVPLDQTRGLEDDRRRASETLARLRQEMGKALGLG